MSQELQFRRHRFEKNCLSVLGEGKNEGLIKTKATRSFKMTGEKCG